jgi:hypothetical protein
VANEDLRIAALATGVGNKKIFKIPYPVKDLAFVSIDQCLRFADLYAGRIAAALITFGHMSLNRIKEDPSIGTGQRAEETVDTTLFVPFNDPGFGVLCKRLGWTRRNTGRVATLQTDRRSKERFFKIFDRLDSRLNRILYSFYLKTGCHTVTAAIA